MAAFTWVNTVLVDTGQPLAVNPPALPMPHVLPGFTVTPGACEVAATWTPLPVGVMVDLWTETVLT
jgi:hypothetical protein